MNYDRTKSIGSSDVAAIFNESPWISPYELWREKIGQPLRHRHSKAMDEGRKAEKYILQRFCDDYGMSIKRYTEPIFHADYPWLSTTPDGIGPMAAKVEHLFAGKEVYVEAKRVSRQAFKSHDWGEEGTDEIPKYYVMQGQHGLFVSGLQHAVYPVSVDGDHKEFLLERNSKLQAVMLDGCKQFWDMVKQKKEPAIDWNDDRIKEVSKYIYTPEPGKVCELSKETSSLAKQYNFLQQRIKVAEDEKKRVKILLEKAMENAELGMGDGVEIVRKIQNRKGFTVAATSFPTLNVKLIKGIE